MLYFFLNVPALQFIDVNGLHRNDLFYIKVLEKLMVYDGVIYCSAHWLPAFASSSYLAAKLGVIM